MTNSPQSRFLPVSAKELKTRGWSEVDVVFVTGDAYVDHPSFAMALLGRLLEAEGYRVAILSQPNWQSAEPWRTFGRPRLCYCISAGNMDSMINHYTANKKVRNDDAYSPAGEIGLRPDRATLAYCQRAREAYPGVPVIAGGVEASLRRFAHYDYWSDRVRRSIIMDAKADLLVYGMGENPITEILRRLDQGKTPRECRDIRGVVYRLGASETLDVEEAATLELPDFEHVSTDVEAFSKMTRILHRETNPFNAKRLAQRHGKEVVVANPPSIPLSQDQMDRYYGLNYQRRPHPTYGDKKIPALTVIKNSVQIMRGCFGGCTFCSITAHEGRVIQSRSEASILEELRTIGADPSSKGVISDIGGPTANMYRMNCSDDSVRAQCRRLSCVHPQICRFLKTDHEPLISLMRQARAIPSLKKISVASGVRMDLALRSQTYINELSQHHTGGLLKVAPEHADPEVLRLMKKPAIEGFEKFERKFSQAAAACGKTQHLVPYFIAGHPGSDLKAMIKLAVYNKRKKLRPDKVQDFIPGPMDIATSMYHTGIDPISGKKVYVAKGAKDRQSQRALLQFWKPENYQLVKEALLKQGRQDLIGPNEHCLIGSRPPSPTEKYRPRQAKASKEGYRPARNQAGRRERKPKKSKKV
jgi:uncharacterized radical SAM protein YgiQ